MPKSKRKISKMKSSSKLPLKGPSPRSPLSLLPEDVKNINVTEFKAINTVNMTEKTPTKNLPKFLIH